MNYAVIMAGGAGTRFWPLSKKRKPKQFLSLFSEKTLLQETIDRLDGFIPQKRAMVITNKDYKEWVSEQIPDIPEEFIIGEPVAKNTAPCIASAAAVLLRDDPDAVMMVMPADHQIQNREALHSVLKAASKTALDENVLVTIGIEPNRPETGYGYIRRENAHRFKKNELPVYKVRNFTEKPDQETAEEFLKSGDYLWNSGIFVWKASVIVEAFKKYLPDLYKHLETLMNSGFQNGDMDEFYYSCPNVSIDYGVMEKADDVYLIPADFDWNDIGSWKAVHELAKKDENGNASLGTEVITEGAKETLVHSKSGKLITLVGVSNIALVETDDSILVLNLDKAQDVKNVVDTLKSDSKTEKYL
jgi:mannose-1-phosphate guanylyltransferase